MWDLIVSVPDHCLSYYFEKIAKLEAKNYHNFDAAETCQMSFTGTS